jgi:hypothetical protein
MGTPVKILSIRPVPPGTGNTLAHFDLELNSHIRLFNLALRQRPGDLTWTVAPNAFHERTAAFGTEFNRAISDLAFKSLLELSANANRS